MKITSFRDKYKGERCYILGNGPSLRDVNLDLLEKEHTFGTNRIYLSGFTPEFYVCVNPLVLKQWGEEIAAIKAVRFVPDWSGLGLPDGVTDGSEGTWVGIDTSLRGPMFSSPEGSMWEGHTVTYVCLQLAFYMGFSEVVLLGVDHDYGEVQRPNLEVAATGPDKHHFHPDYFTGGARWNLPDLGRSEVAYSLAAAAFKRDGRRVVNCSHKTKLKVFPVLPWNHVLSGEKVRVSAIVSGYKCGGELMNGVLDDLGRQTEMPEIVVVAQSKTAELRAARTWEYNNELPIVVVETKDVPTVYAAWNMGIKRASGRYITNYNTDDRRHPEALRIQATLLDGREDIDLVYHDTFVTWDAGQSFWEFMEENRDTNLHAGRWEGKPGYFAWPDYRRATLGKGCYIGPMPMWRAALHQRYGYFLDHFKVAGDYEFWLRVAKAGNMLHVGEMLGVYAARLDGLELGNPIETADETALAMVLHQEPDGMEVQPGNTHVFVRLGEGWSVVDRETLGRVLDAVRSGDGGDVAEH